MVNMAVLCPLHIFPQKPLLSDLTLGDKRAPPPRPGTYPQNLSIIYTANNCKGSKTQQKSRWDYSSHPLSPFLLLFKTDLPLSFILAKQRIFEATYLEKHLFLKTIIRHMFEKKLSDLFYFIIPTGRVERG